MQLPLHKKEVSIKDFFSKYDQILSFLRIWSHLLNKSLMGNFVFSAVPSLLRHTEMLARYMVYESLHQNTYDTIQD